MVEETVILKRWKSPSIIEALQYPNALRMVIFCSAIFFKFRVINKRMQLYGQQIDKGEKKGTEDLLNVKVNHLCDYRYSFLVTQS